MESSQQDISGFRGSILRRACVAVMVSLIDGYRFFLSPWIGQSCRFDPTCSRYAREAIIRHGPLRGSWLALRRLSHCHPWHEGGHDPVPPSPSGIPVTSCPDTPR